MNSHRIAIRLTIPSTSGLMHQLRNYAEDLYRSFRDVRYAVVENEDTAIDTVWVRIQSDGKVRPAKEVIESVLKEHLLSDRCEVIVDPE